jgi:hypothetical protein
VAISQSCDDAGVAQLILELSASLDPSQRAAFISAAQAALAEIDCNHLGLGLAYRRLRDLQRSHYDYPSDARVISGPRHQRRRPSKLAGAEPIGADDPRTGARDRHRFGAV